MTVRYGSAEVAPGSRGHADETAAAPSSRLVAVLEVEPGGHRLDYVAHLVGAGGADRCRVLVSERVAESSEFRSRGPELGPSTVLRRAATRREALRSAVEAAEAIGASTLVIPDGDLYLLPLLITVISRPRLRLQIRLLLMRTTTISRREGIRPALVIKPVLVQLLRLCRPVRVFFLTDALGVVSRRRGFPGIPAVKDPVPKQQFERTAAPRPDWLPRSGTASSVVGVFGVVSSRKNLPLLVAAVALARDTILVVAGRLEDDVRAFLETDDVACSLREQERLLVTDRLLTPAELSSGLMEVDLVAVLHDNDAPSGILAEACVRHTPVLVPAGGWLAEVVESTGIGAVTPLTDEDVAEAILRVHRSRGQYAEAARRSSERINTDSFVDRMLGP